MLHLKMHLQDRCRDQNQDWLLVEGRELKQDLHQSPWIAFLRHFEAYERYFGETRIWGYLQERKRIPLSISVRDQEY